MTNLTPRSSSPISFDSRSLEGVPTSSKEDLSDPVSAEESSTSDQELSEVQLRHLYDEEEVERFMYFFSAVGTLYLCVPHKLLSFLQYVTEVRLPSASKVQGNVTPPPLPPRPGVTTEPRCTSPIPPLPGRPSDRSLSEHFANVSLLVCCAEIVLEVSNSFCSLTYRWTGLHLRRSL